MAGLCLLFTSGVTSGLKCEISGTIYREFSQNYSARAARAHQEFGSDRCDSHPVHIHAKFARPSSHRVHFHAKSAGKSSHPKSHPGHIRNHIHAKSIHFQELHPIRWLLGTTATQFRYSETSVADLHPPCGRSAQAARAYMHEIERVERLALNSLMRPLLS